MWWMIVIAWLVAGNVLFWILTDKDVMMQFYFSIAAMVLWPVALGLKLYHVNKDRKRENLRQQTITAKIALGDYDEEYAREHLKWKG